MRVTSQHYVTILIGAAFLLTPFLSIFSAKLAAYIPLISGAAAGFMCLALSFEKRGAEAPALPFKPPRAFLGFALGIVILTGVSAFWSDHPSHVIDKVLKLSALLGVAMLSGAAYSFLDVEKLRPRLWWLAAALSIAMIVCSIDMLTGMPLFCSYHPNSCALTPTTAEYNRAILILLFYALLCLPLLVKSAGKTEKIAIAVLAVSLAFMLFVTQSQSGQMAVILAVLVYFLFPVRSLIAWRALQVLIVAGVLSAPWLAQFLFHDLTPYALQIGWLEEGYAPARLEIWDFVSRYALHSPIYGYGLDATRFVEAFDTARLYHPTAQVMHPHNFVLQIWMEFGAVGAALASAALVTLVELIRSQDEQTRRLYIAAFITLGAVGAVSYGLWQAWWNAYLLSAFILLRLVARMRRSPA